MISDFALLRLARVVMELSSMNLFTAVTHFFRINIHIKKLSAGTELLFIHERESGVPCSYPTIMRSVQLRSIIRSEQAGKG